MQPSETTSIPRIPCLDVAEIDLPPELEQLYHLAYNLWWTWSPEARRLFSACDSASWSLYHNPVQLLLNLDRRQLESLVENEVFMGDYAAVVREFQRAVGSAPVAGSSPGDPVPGPIAYFSMEYGVHQSLAIYSGGLGVLSGDHLKSASDLGLPLVGVGLLYRFGYFQQTIDADGVQQHTYPEYDFTRLPIRPVAGGTGRELVVSIPFPGRDVRARVWLAQVGRVPLLLLDTDVAQNDAADRPITLSLYVRGREMRLAQEMVLGVGGARALAALGVEPAVWHLNEGHSVLLQLERMSRARTAPSARLADLVERVRGNVAFTTHTPVPAGHEQYDRDLMGRMLGPWSEPLGVAVPQLLSLGDDGRTEEPAKFNLTAFALRASSYTNGVSRINAEVSQRMWADLDLDGRRPVIHAITNGVHLPTWLGVEMRDLLTRAFGPDWLRRQLPPEAWQAVYGIADGEIWEAHLAQKDRLGRFSRSRVREQMARHGHSPSVLRTVGESFDRDALTIGFARRFATYKRAGLLFRDLDRLRALVTDTARPLQIFLAGKAHPADRPGQDLIRHIFELSQEEPLRGRVVFLENYDLRVARMLVQGVDLWLNTPRRPLEASGTSGQKAAINGVLNCSIADGWWPEAFDGENGWVFGDAATGSEVEQDAADAEALYRTLEEDITPLFHRRDESGIPREWVRRMKHSIATVAAGFSSARMVEDYYREAYRPLAGRRELAVPKGS